MRNEYLELDNLSDDGTFTLPLKDDFNLAAMTDYCKRKNIPCEDLTAKEVEMFVIHRSDVTKEAV